MTIEFKQPISWCYENKIYALNGDLQGIFSMYDISAKKWIVLPKLPAPVAFASGAMLDHAIYVIGGVDSLLHPTRAFQKFDVQQNQWIQLPSMPDSRSHSVSVVCKGKIYVIGGELSKDEHHIQSSSLIDVYNPDDQTWLKKSAMPTARSDPSAIVINDEIIVAGGYTNAGMTDIVEKYDPSTDRWTRQADLPFPNALFGFVIFQNSIYALGGKPEEGMSPILKYDAEADQWTQVSTVPVTQNRLGTVVVGDRIYIIGGEGNPQALWIGKKV